MHGSQPTVCVIGAGLSGLVSVKCMLDAGFKVTCFELEDFVAGKWNPYCEHPIPKSTITNLPHFLSGYSDFPVPDDFPLYIPAELYCKYFELYVEKFNLLPHIKLGCKVIDAIPLVRFNNSDTSGEHYWQIKYESKDGIQIELEFDYVVVCSGFYQAPFIPDQMNNAVSTFKGSVMHCIKYKTWKEFEGKNVVVCGLGNSGGDIVVELSQHMQKTYLSTSRGSYVLGRIYKGGSIPIELSANRMAQYIPESIKNYLTRYTVRNMAHFVYNQDDLRLTPKSHTSVIVNDELCIRIASGKVVIKPGIEKAVDHSVYFTNGTCVDNIDTIIFCTGYKRLFPFFSEKLFQMETKGKYIPLYNGIFSPNFENNICFVGMFNVFGSVALTSEMQARYAAEVFRGNVKLPSKKEMEVEIKSKEEFLKTSYGDDIKEYNLVSNPWTYYDKLAVEIGCRPSLFYLWLCDPVLAWNLCTTYSPNEYRLIGPNKWSGARDTIVNRSQRMYSFMAGSRKVI